MIDYQAYKIIGPAINVGFFPYINLVSFYVPGRVPLAASRVPRAGASTGRRDSGQADRKINKKQRFSVLFCL